MSGERHYELVSIATCPTCGGQSFEMDLHPEGDEVRSDDDITCVTCGLTCKASEADEAGAKRAANVKGS